MNVKAYHDNIKSSQFDSHYFAQFNVVLNALDNVDARRHVNRLTYVIYFTISERLCLAADVPLIDSGTTGYLGQVNHNIYLLSIDELIKGDAYNQRSDIML